MDIGKQKKLKSSFGLAVSLASAALPAIAGCQSSQKNYIGTAVQTVDGVSRTVSYREERSSPGVPPKGTLTVESRDGSLVVYHDHYGDGWLDGKDVFGPRNKDDTTAPKPISSQRWIRFSRLNILSVVADMVEEYFPDREHQRAQHEYLNWLTWLRGEKR